MSKKIIKSKVRLDDSLPALDEGINSIQNDDENTVAVGLSQAKVRYPGDWIKATDAEIKKYSDEGRLFGHDPDTGEVLIDVIKK